jgi:hypothetical protein
MVSDQKSDGTAISNARFVIVGSNGTHDPLLAAPRVGEVMKPTKPRWRKMYMVACKLAIGLVHRNLITAYPEKDIDLLRISAISIVDEKVKQGLKAKTQREKV